MDSKSKKNRKNNKTAPIAVLDVGTSKICCMIAHKDEAGDLKVSAMSHQASFGLRAGAIANMDLAESAIGAAVQTAEQLAGETVRKVYVNLSGGQPGSSHISVQVAAGNQPIGTTQLFRIAGQCRQALGELEGTPVHVIPTSYTLDGASGIHNPRGMVGSQLEVELHAVTANSAAVRNLVTCVERCHLGVEQVVVSPLAAGRACLTDDEAELGSILIDMGGGTTTIGVFSEGEMVFCDAIPIGGTHVTNDIARGLTTPTAHAERMKILYGHAMTTTTDRHDMIDVPQVGEQGIGVVAQVPRSILNGIIQPRLEEVFELVRSRLEHSGFDRVGGRRVVLTGGACQMQGVRELAQLILDRQIRIGKPPPIAGLGEEINNPSFSVVAGLLFYATQPNREYRVLNTGEKPRGLFGRIGEWVRDNVSAA
jgi:cell division protein FtsA